MTNNAWGALSDETRRKVVELLKSRPHTAGEIADQFSLSPATVSHHLSVLKGCALVKCERRAQTLIYSLNLPAFRALQKELSRLFN